ncbi:MAG: hypothetical protein ACYCQI_03770 [Gammaproteobacteria bacterium]
MRYQFKILALLLLASFSLNCYAIQVNVKSTSNDIMALGFSVNGENHGGLGTSYSNDNVPVGDYIFGVRAHNNNDITCYTNQGKASIHLNKSTTATLHYDGKNCKVQLSP